MKIQVKAFMVKAFFTPLTFVIVLLSFSNEKDKIKVLQQFSINSRLIVLCYVVRLYLTSWSAVCLECSRPAGRGHALLINSAGRVTQNRGVQSGERTTEHLLLSPQRATALLTAPSRPNWILIPVVILDQQPILLVKQVF